MDFTRTFEQVREASRTLALFPPERVDEVLGAVADEIEASTAELLEANAFDLARMAPENPRYDRLRLTAERLSGIAADMRKVAELPSPLGCELSHTTLPNGLDIRRVSAPFGVIGVVYEARPNVTFDVFALTLKAGSACVLKGGSDADASNCAAVALIHRVLVRLGVPIGVVHLLPPDRESTTALLHARGHIDLIIPRGSRGLIDYVRSEATVPVIETGAGVCHTYVDSSADLAVATAIVCNAKTRRVSVCNALDCLLLHASRLAHLPTLCAPLAEHRVLIYADEAALAALRGAYPDELLQPATAESFGTEFLDYKMALRTVPSLDEALRHIRLHGSGHSEAVVAEDEAVVARFQTEVDAACVYANAPTSFTDGAQFGLGAEIGISTQKLHARGPMALQEIVTYKWLVRGHGQTRP